MKSPLNSKGQMVLLLESNDPQQCAYTDTTVASWLQACEGGRRIHDLYFQNTSPLTADGIKKRSATASKGRLFLKQAMSIPGPEEWMAVTLSHAISGRFLLVIRKLQGAFAVRWELPGRLCGPLVPALYHSVLEEERKAVLKLIKAVGQNGSYSAVIWNCL